jgi:citrate lyase subunit beta/citryl-CoA lyase
VTDVQSRSYLYVPADRPDRLARAFERGADALIVDLEDAVAPANKLRARHELVSWLAQAAAPVWIRINSGEIGRLDVEALLEAPNLAGLCLAKTGSAAEVSAVAQRFDAVGRSVPLVPLLEDAAAVLDARAIGAAPGVRRLQLGEADLRAELGIVVSAGEPELLALRSHVVLASAANKIDPPVGPVSTNFTDLDALAESTRALRRMGFFGRACIHPAQVPVVNAVFTPTAQEVDWAQSILQRLDAAGGGATTSTDGAMIDEAVARAARRILDTAR